MVERILLISLNLRDCIFSEGLKEWIKWVQNILLSNGSSQVKPPRFSFENINYFLPGAQFLEEHFLATERYQFSIVNKGCALLAIAGGAKRNSLLECYSGNRHRGKYHEVKGDHVGISTHQRLRMQQRRPTKCNGC